MIDVIEEFSRETICFVALGRWVWRCRRVNTDQLRRVGHAHLEGSEAYRRVQEEIARERKEQIVAHSHTDPEARAAALAKMAEAERTRALAKLHAMTSKPESEEALLERCDAYLRASVDAGAQLATPVAGAQRYDDEPELAAGWTPWTWVGADEPEDREAGHVAIGRLPPSERILLGLAVQGAQEGVTRRRVEPFRAGPGAASAAAPPGDGVRHGPGGDRVRGHVGGVDG